MIDLKGREILARELVELDPLWAGKFDTIQQAAAFYDLDELWYELTGEKLADDSLERYRPIEHLGQAFEYLDEIGVEYD